MHGLRAFARRTQPQGSCPVSPPARTGLDTRQPLSVGQEKDDFCLSNCSVYWQGLCAWRDLSGEDVGVEAAARDIVAKFWDAEAGYWCDSWDAKAARPRPFRPLHGFYHVSRFAREVFACAAAGGAGGAAPRPAPIAAYMERHFLLGDRLAMYDREDLAIRRADGNQFGAYYPVQDRTFWNAMNLAGRTDSLALFRRIVGSHGRVLPTRRDRRSMSSTPIPPTTPTNSATSSSSPPRAG